jgi:hypothetical protein
MTKSEMLSEALGHLQKAERNGVFPFLKPPEYRIEQVCKACRLFSKILEEILEQKHRGNS